MERTDPWGPPGSALQPDPVLRAFEGGVAAIGRLAVAFGIAEEWAARTPCPEWRARDLAGHLRCIVDDYHEYLDDAPASRYARLLGSGPHPQALARKLARQNAAELAALPDAPPDEHLAAFLLSARAYARRLPPVWGLPHPPRRGPAAPPVPGRGGDGGGHGRRRDGRVAPARLGPGLGARRRAPPGRPR